MLSPGRKWNPFLSLGLSPAVNDASLEVCKPAAAPRPRAAARIGVHRAALVLAALLLCGCDKPPAEIPDPAKTPARRTSSP